MLVNFSSPGPAALRGPVLIDGAGLPRYWAAVWASFLPADLAPATVRKKLGHLENFYQHADQFLGLGGLDDALALLNVDALSSALEGYFLTLRNRPSITPACEENWQVAIQFVTDIAQRLTRNSLTPEQHDALSGRLMRLELLNSHLHVGKRRRPEHLRSLPADVLEAHYEMLDPESHTNPFREGRSRWLVYTVFMLLLHQGLRRSELLIFPADVIKNSFDRSLQKERFWMTVKYNEYEDDPRYSKPSIKNASSIRQLPVSQTIALLVQEYVANYRGRPDHSFLINSQRQSPLSTEGLTKTFQKITASLPKSVRRTLRDHTGEESITPHNLRHTCAVVRLNQLLSDGIKMEDALQQMRAFFGWSRSSDMPLRYASAVFEHRLASVWRNEFDERVEVLRSLPARLK
jgi:integrase